MNIASFPKALKHSFIFAAYEILSFILTFPLIFNMNSRILTDPTYTGRGDGGGFIWTFWWIRWAVLDRGEALLTTDFLTYPTVINLGNVYDNVLTVILSVPLTAVFDIVTTYNIFVLATLATCAFTAYLLVFDLTRDRRLAFLAGFTFGFSPFLLIRATGHLNILSIEWLPLMLMFLLRFVHERKRKDALLAALFFVLNAFGSWHLAIIASVLIACLLLYWLIVDRAMILNAPFLKSFILFAAVSTLLLTPFVYPIVKAKINGEIKTHLVEASHAFSVPLIGFFVPPASNTFFRYVPWNWKINEIMHKNINYVEFTNFLGFVELALLAYWLLRVPKKRSSVFFFFTFVVFGVLSLGPFLKLIGSESPVIVLPYYMFFYLPFMSFMRTPNRFVIVMILMLAILNADAIAYFLKKHGGMWKKRKALAMFSLLFIALFFERMTYPIRTIETKVSDFYYTIANDPIESYRILDLPLVPSTEYNYLQTVHHKKLLLGGFYDVQNKNEIFSFIANHAAIIDLQCAIFQRLPGEDHVAFFREQHVKYVISHVQAQIPNGEAAGCFYEPQIIEDLFGKERVVFQDDDIQVFQMYE
ncbi:MAG: hypothetical protein HYV34_03015 [Candidatus Kerfeldbacteria bacterium]|nr:hypothetical protein [Candidatus Kerfeldbacteria bacterium]